MHILDKYILENHLNLAELANILGYDTGNLSKVINGIIGVSPRLANTIKQKLQIEIESTKRPKRYNIIKDKESNQNIIHQQQPNVMKVEELENAVKILTTMYVEERKSNQEKDRIIEDLLKPNSREVG